MGTNVKQFNETEFNKDVIESGELYLIDFWAPWCGPCRMMAPILDDYSTKQSKVKVGKINVDENQDLAIKLKISGIPTMLVFQNGKEVDRIVGLLPINMLEQKLSKYQ